MVETEEWADSGTTERRFFTEKKETLDLSNFLSKTYMTLKSDFKVSFF